MPVHVMSMGMVVAVAVVMPVRMAMCMIVTVMVVMLLVFVGFRVQPGSHVRDLALGIIKTGVEKIFHRRIICLRVQPAGAGIELLQTLPEGVEGGPRLFAFNEIGLGEDQPVGNSGLLARFLVIVEGRQTVDRVHKRDHAVEPVAHHQIGMQHDRVQDGRRIRQTRRLDDHPVEPVHAAVIQSAQQVFERRDKIAANGAAQATGGKLHDAVAGLIDKQMIEPDLAEFIDDDRCVRHRRILQDPIEERCLA